MRSRESPGPGPASKNTERQVMAVKTLTMVAALVLALGVLTIASVAFAERTGGEEVQAPRSHSAQDLQAP